MYVILFIRYITLTLFDSFKSSKVNVDIKLISELFVENLSTGTSSGVIAFKSDYKTVWPSVSSKWSHEGQCQLHQWFRDGEHPCKDTTLCMQFLSSYCVHKVVWPRHSLKVQKGRTNVNINLLDILMWRTSLSRYNMIHVLSKRLSCSQGIRSGAEEWKGHLRVNYAIKPTLCIFASDLTIFTLSTTSLYLPFLLCLAFV